MLSGLEKISFVRYDQYANCCTVRLMVDLLNICFLEASAAHCCAVDPSSESIELLTTVKHPKDFLKSRFYFEQGVSQLDVLFLCHTFYKIILRCLINLAFLDMVTSLKYVVPKCFGGCRLDNG